MAHSHTELVAHIVSSTRDRQPSIGVQWKGDLLVYIGGIARKMCCKVVAIGGMAEHTHLLMGRSANIVLAELVRVAKSVASYAPAGAGTFDMGAYPRLTPWGYILTPLPGLGSRLCLS